MESKVESTAVSWHCKSGIEMIKFGLTTSMGRMQEPNILATPSDTCPTPASISAETMRMLLSIIGSEVHSSRIS
eukprot:6195722-Pleurochrysis_carterae.AAC.2